MGVKRGKEKGGKKEWKEGRKEKNHQQMGLPIQKKKKEGDGSGREVCVLYAQVAEFDPSNPHF